jgi:hypothetical protein
MINPVLPCGQEGISFSLATCSHVVVILACFNCVDEISKAQTEYERYLREMLTILLECFFPLCRLRRSEAHIDYIVD